MNNNDKVIRAAKITVSYTIMTPVVIVAAIIVIGLLIAFAQQIIATSLPVLVIAGGLGALQLRHEKAKKAARLLAATENLAAPKDIIDPSHHRWTED